MTAVRGTFVLNTFDFIREHYSPAAHTMVLQMLPGARSSLSEACQTSWTPLEDLVAYMETAKAVLAPGDPAFYRKIGFYGGSHTRALWVGIAVSEPTRALRFCATLWQTFFDAGRLEVIEACPAGAILRIHDLPWAASFCQRFLGSLEGILSLSAIPVRVEDRACICRGDVYCEIFVTREPTRSEHVRAAPAMTESSPVTGEVSTRDLAARV
jgi:hypothetical protein